LARFARSVAQGNPARPAGVCTFARESHASDPGGASTRVQVGLSYSDGFGARSRRRRRPRPPRPDRQRQSRWVGSGWTVFNNKGKPVRQFEPFFTPTSAFEFGLQVGVSAVLFYDPVERVVATLRPDHTYDKLVVDAWRQRAYDANDTCAPSGVQTAGPRTDPDIGGIVRAYFAATDPANAWTTWYAQRIGDALGANAKQAAIAGRRPRGHTGDPPLDPQGRNAADGGRRSRRLHGASARRHADAAAHTQPARRSRPGTRSAGRTRSTGHAL